MSSLRYLEIACSRTIRTILALTSIFFSVCLYPNLKAAPLLVGAPAPLFNLPDADGAPTSLKRFKGKWVLLYFYPRDFTAGCTVEAHNFQRDLAKYQQRNVIILGVSVDTVQSHKGFCTKQSLNFKLLSDTDYQASEEYGSLMEFQGKKYASRNTFIIDPSGIIRRIYLGVNPVTHSREVLADLPNLQGH